MKSSPKGVKGHFFKKTVWIMRNLSRHQCSPTGDIFRIKRASNFAPGPNRNVYRIVVEKLQL